jgi:hypothetical protein
MLKIKKPSGLGFSGIPKVHSKLFEVLKTLPDTPCPRQISREAGPSKYPVGDSSGLLWHVLPKTGTRFVSIEEMREILLHADDNFRVHTLRQAKNFLGVRKQT